MNNMQGQQQQQQQQRGLGGTGGMGGGRGRKPSMNTFKRSQQQYMQQQKQQQLTPLRGKGRFAAPGLNFQLNKNNQMNQQQSQNAIAQQNVQSPSLNIHHVDQATQLQKFHNRQRKPGHFLSKLREEANAGTDLGESNEAAGSGESVNLLNMKKNNNNQFKFHHQNRKQSLLEEFKKHHEDLEYELDQIDSGKEGEEVHLTTIKTPIVTPGNNNNSTTKQTSNGKSSKSGGVNGLNNSTDLFNDINLEVLSQKG